MNHKLFDCQKCGQDMYSIRTTDGEFLHRCYECRYTYTEEYLLEVMRLKMIKESRNGYIIPIDNPLIQWLETND